MVDGRTLTTWEKGDRLTADGLNGNFLKLYEMVIEAMAAARMPDGAVVGLEMAQGRLTKRVEGLEQLTAMHAHQRNERQYVPLSALGSMITMVNDLRQEVEKAIARMDDLYAGLRAEFDNLYARLACLEQQADATDKELLPAGTGDHERLAVDAGSGFPQIVESRHA